MRVDFFMANGKRTTVRIADDLWDCFLYAFDSSEAEAKEFLIENLSNSPAVLLSPSEAARSFMFGFITGCLKDKKQ